MSLRRTMRLCLASTAVITAVVAGTLAGTAGVASAATAVPVITGTNTSTGSPALPTYTDQQVVEVSAPANTTFASGSPINILMCADPGGTTGNLPVDDTTCDGNTQNTDTILASSNGSFDYVNGGDGGSYSGYQLLLLPSADLGETAGDVPKCDATHACVLFIGNDQTNFTAPHVFSAPFYMAASASPPPVTPEAPYAVILPIAAGGIVIGAVFFTTVRRRRRQGVES